MDIKKILFKTNSFDVEKSLPDATIIINPEGKIVWVSESATELFQTSRIHLLTSNIKDFIESAIDKIHNAIILNKVVITKKFQEETYYDLSAKSIDKGYIITLRPTEISTVPTLSSNEPCKNEFLLKISNEFKAPIQSIVGFSQAMADGLGGSMNEQQEKYIKIINKNSQEMMYFLTKMFEFLQTESTDKKIELKTFDFINLIKVLLKYNEQLYKEKEVKLHLEIQENINKTIITDENILKNILQDLIEIYIKAVDLGQIVIKISTPSLELIKSKKLLGNNYVMISISSKSLLLSENDLEYMFEPYKIVDSTNKKNLLRAIILASIKNMVQKINGIIWVESKVLKDTTFNIILPMGE